MATTWTIVDNSAHGEVLHIADLDFGFRDERGRAVGCSLVVKLVTAYERPAGLDYGRVSHSAYFESSIYSTRDGRKYGAIPRAKRLPEMDVEAARADVLKRAEQSKRRQAKAHAHTGGRLAP